MRIWVICAGAGSMRRVRGSQEDDGLARQGAWLRCREPGSGPAAGGPPVRPKRWKISEPRGPRAGVIRRRRRPSGAGTDQEYCPSPSRAAACLAGSPELRSGRFAVRRRCTGGPSRGGVSTPPVRCQRACRAAAVGLAQLLGSGSRGKRLLPRPGPPRHFPPWVGPGRPAVSHKYRAALSDGFGCTCWQHFR
jgi:hypothetical protein